ncbi:hypothetical protein F5972_08570 [Microbispora cellulosiformans]|uniref:Uncharacterized protein n=1 Tax=Microbispora cellulosiformans TaxID=2614688 RepID=A0A5J5K517_9ACTN|nr:hypothetical protein [Microbispora cellulosiformans]KAA9379695.1 hypothetical protein F5972_08570 [Microbispora cellulosiformans]
MTAHFLVTCPDHRLYAAGCDDDAWYRVDTAAAAMALHEARFPGTTARKTARVVIGCEIGGCRTHISLTAASVAEARALLSEHNEGWYQARRSGGRLVDGCQWHLGSCCVHHAALYPDSPTLDPTAVLPAVGQPAPGPEPVQLDLFAPRAA